MGLLLIQLPVLYGSEARMGTGYRQGHLTWNIAIDSIDVLSELRWSRLQIWETYGSLRLPLSKQWELGAWIGGGPIFCGQSRDSDYAHSGRQKEFARSYADSTGHVLQFGLQLSRPKRLRTCSNVVLAPQIGLEWNQQFVQDTNAVLVIEEWGVAASAGILDSYDQEEVQGPDEGWGSPDVGKNQEIYKELGAFGMGGIVCTYSASWSMISWGFRLYNRLSRRLSWEATAGIKTGLFVGRGDWKLREFIFYHIAPAMGLKGVVQGIWQCRPRLALCLTLQGDYFYAWDGIELIKIEEGAFQGPDMSEAIWRSLGASLGLRYCF